MQGNFVGSVLIVLVLLAQLRQLPFLNEIHQQSVAKSPERALAVCVVADYNALPRPAVESQQEEIEELKRMLEEK